MLWWKLDVANHRPPNEAVLHRDLPKRTIHVNPGSEVVFVSCWSCQCSLFVSYAVSSGGPCTDIQPHLQLTMCAYLSKFPTVMSSSLMFKNCNENTHTHTKKKKAALSAQQCREHAAASQHMPIQQRPKATKPDPRRPVSLACCKSGKERGGRVCDQRSSSSESNKLRTAGTKLAKTKRLQCGQAAASARGRGRG